MSASSTPTPNPRKSRTYFVIGFALLFVMAITWALDNSFVYTSFGAAAFFFFLAYYNRTRPKNFSGSYSGKQRGFEEFFDSGTKKQSAHHNRPQSHQTQNSNKLVMAVMLFIGGLFTVIMIAVLFADDASVEMTNADSIYEKAEHARYQGNYDSAEYYYRKILIEDPENLNALNGMGILSLNRERYDNAINQFDAALRVDPDFDYARYNKALTLYYQHNYKRSLSETFDLMKRSPEYYDAMALAGDNYYSQQRYDSAKYWFDQSYDNGVRTAWLCYVLGYLYDKDAQTEKAVTLYNESLVYDSAQAEIYVRLGELYPGEEGNIYRAKALQFK